MNPLLASLLAAGVGAGYGVWLRRTLNQLRYRTPDEHHQPPPGPRRWIIPTTAAAAGLLAHSAATSATPWLYLSLLPLLATGPALAAIDHDVMRLPNRILGPTALASLAGILTATIVLQQPTTAVQALLGAVLAGSVFYLTNRITHGGIGMGDVKLATLIGTTIAPSASPSSSPPSSPAPSPPGPSTPSGTHAEPSPTAPGSWPACSARVCSLHSCGRLARSGTRL
ncbi:MAG: prepilin peptidase [Micropruina sp.]|nr:MAG: prepilin peptidase [Micropruina sp.]